MSHCVGWSLAVKPPYCHDHVIQERSCDVAHLSYTEFSIECEECKNVAAEVKCTTCKNYLCDKCFEMVRTGITLHNYMYVARITEDPLSI